MGGELDLIVVPSVGPMPRLEHRVVAAEPVVVVQAGPPDIGPVELPALVDQPLLLVPDSCGLTRFTRQLFEDNGLRPRRYPGEAASYGVLEDWARLGLGVAVLPESKLAVPQEGPPSRPLLEDGHEVEIFYEVVWDPASALAADLRALADALAAR